MCPFGTPTSFVLSAGVLFPIMLHGEASPVATLQEVTFYYFRLEKRHRLFEHKRLRGVKSKDNAKIIMQSFLICEYMSSVVFYN